MPHPPSFTASMPPQMPIGDWPALYRGVRLTIEPLEDGTFRGVVEGGFFSEPCADLVEALAAATDWIDQTAQSR